MNAAEIVAELNAGRDSGDPVLTYRKLDHWSTSGLLGEEVSRIGSGRIREFGDTEVSLIRIIAPLVHAGFELQVAARIAERIVLQGADSFPLGDDFVLLYRPTS